MDSLILKIFIPEIFLSFSILFQLFLNVCIINKLSNNFPLLSKEIFFQCFFIFFCLYGLILNTQIEGYFHNFLFSIDLSVKLNKLFIIITCLCSLLSIFRGFSSQNLNFFEFFTVFLIAILSILLLVSSSDLLSTYLVLEMQVLSFYILSCFKRNSAFSTEAGLKYFIIGSFISGLFLFGCSMIYGLTGTLNFNYLSLILSAPFSVEYYIYYQFLSFGILIILIVFLFKISAAPFHFWSPDVYEGAPTAVTIIFSVIPKFAVFYLTIKWLSIANIFNDLKIILFISGVLSIFLGSFFALKQKRLKRLLIFSSIAQTGFLLVALSTNNLNSSTYIYFFLIVYIITSLLIWSNFSLLFDFQNRANFFYNKINYSLFLSTISSFFKLNKNWSLSNIIIFSSLAGIPPLAGFFSKIFILYSIVEVKSILFAFVLLMMSAFSVFYYLRIIKLTFFEKETSQKQLDVSQIIFNDFFFDFDCTSISFLLFSLLFLFCYPALLTIYCGLVAFNFYLF